jgi:hypothetical protein
VVNQVGERKRPKLESCHGTRELVVRGGRSRQVRYREGDILESEGVEAVRRSREEGIGIGKDEQWVSGSGITVVTAVVAAVVVVVVGGGAEGGGGGRGGVCGESSRRRIRRSTRLNRKRRVGGSTRAARSGKNSRGLQKQAEIRVALFQNFGSLGSTAGMVAVEDGGGGRGRRGGRFGEGGIRRKIRLRTRRSRRRRVGGSARDTESGKTALRLQKRASIRVALLQHFGS